LLYWESAASIIPARLVDDEQERSSYASELMRARLLDAVSPERILDFNFDAFSDGFLSLLRTRTLVNSVDDAQGQLIHEDKMSNTVYRELEDRALARRLPDSYGWWIVESRTAALYMAYLTGAICGANRSLFPVTDSSGSMALLNPTGSAGLARLQAMRHEVLTQTLPAPSRSVNARQLRSFKDDNRDGGRWMTDDPGGNCEPGSGFMAAAANQVKPTFRMK
jgi:hypothetical protein